MTEPVLLVEHPSDALAIVTLNRPDRRNALSIALLEAAANAENAAWEDWSRLGEAYQRTDRFADAAMRFHEAIAFQWINPKAWMMVLTAATTIHLSADFGFNAMLMAVLFYVTGLPCICLWAAFGTSLRRVLSNPRWLRAFNIVMASLLVLSMYPIALHLLG